MTSNELPRFKDVRERIEGIKSSPHRFAFKYQYLTGTRSSEVCGKWHIRGKDFELNKHEDHPLIVFWVRTAKRDGRIRLIALPLEPEYEPWAADLVKYFEKRKDREKVFNFTRRTLQNYGRKHFNGLSYQIEKYRHNKQTIESHSKKLTTHGIRHIRATELMMRYGFDQIDLTIFMGWTFRASLKTVPEVIERYIYMQWSRYFPKLLKPLA